MDICGRLRCYGGFYWFSSEEEILRSLIWGRARPGLDISRGLKPREPGQHPWIGLFCYSSVPVPGHLLNPWIFEVELCPVNIKPYMVDM